MVRKTWLFCLLIVTMMIGVNSRGVSFAENDSLALKPLDPAVAKRIQDYRTREVRLIVKDASGQLVKDQDIQVEQESHEFLFGCNIFLLKGGLWTPSNIDPELERVYLERFGAVFNYATIPFYWSGYEYNRGATQEKKLHEIAQWCLDHGIRPKAHPLVWHETLPMWLTDRSAEEFEPMLKNRVQTIVHNFDGQINMFDVINESLASANYNDNAVGTWVKKLGPTEAARRALTWAREANPKAFLLINDYNIEQNYADEVKALIKSGCAPDAVGVQSHMHHGNWSPGELWQVCERFKRTGLPIHFSELTVLSGAYMTDNDYSKTRTNWKTNENGERQQAQEVYKIYTTLFSHPSVQAITWWDLSDYGAWMGAPAGLIRSDMSPKPAYEVLQRLIKKEWWTGPLQLKTNPDGQVTFRGFFGKYRLTVNGRVVEFDLTKAGSDTIEVMLGQ